MSATYLPTNTSVLKKLEHEPVISFTPDPATHQKYSSGSSIFSLSKSASTSSPTVDVHSNPLLDISSCLNSQQSTLVLVASVVVKMLEDMGVQYAFGVSGGALAPL